MKKLILASLLIFGTLTQISTTNVSATPSEPHNTPIATDEQNVITGDEATTWSENQPKLGNWNVVVSKRNGYNTINTDFVPSAKVTTTQYGLVKGKHVKQCSSRIQEGSSDTGRKYSYLATSIYDNNRWNAYAQLWDDPFYSHNSYYGWFYF